MLCSNIVIVLEMYAASRVLAASNGRSCNDGKACPHPLHHCECVSATDCWQDEDPHLPLRELLYTPSGIVTVVAELLALLAMLPFVVIELGSLKAYLGGWLSLWNMLDVITYTLQASSTPSRLCSSKEHHMLIESL